MDTTRSITLSYEDLLDLLTTAAQVGISEANNTSLSVRSDITQVVERRMRPSLARLGN